MAEKLLPSLMDAARSTGVKTLADITLYDNRGILLMPRKPGFMPQRDAGNPSATKLRIDLAG